MFAGGCEELDWRLSVMFDSMGAMTDSPILLVLVGCSVITLGVALERLYYYRKRSGNGLAFLQVEVDAGRRPTYQFVPGVAGSSPAAARKCVARTPACRPT